MTYNQHRRRILLGLVRTLELDKTHGAQYIYFEQQSKAPFNAEEQKRIDRVVDDLLIVLRDMAEQ